MRLDDDQLLRALVAVGKAGGLTIVHAENDAIINRLRSDFIQLGKLNRVFTPSAAPRFPKGKPWNGFWPWQKQRKLPY